MKICFYTYNDLRGSLRRLSFFLSRFISRSQGCLVTSDILNTPVKNCILGSRVFAWMKHRQNRIVTTRSSPSSSFRRVCGQSTMTSVDLWFLRVRGETNCPLSSSSMEDEKRDSPIAGIGRIERARVPFFCVTRSRVRAKNRNNRTVNSRACRDPDIDSLRFFPSFTNTRARGPMEVATPGATG